MADIASDELLRQARGYRVFPRAQWSALCSDVPMTLTDADVVALRGAGDPVSLREVEDVLVPLGRLLDLHVTAARQLARSEAAFLRQEGRVPPFVIAIAGSVAVGKSTFARLLQAVLARWPNHRRVALVATDGFLHPNRVLEERGLMERKGFPESYDLRRMIAFLRALKAGEEARVPVYSHAAYDILPDQAEVIRQPDVVILEGLNVLQVPQRAVVSASDFFDFSIYLDAAEADIRRWFIERVLVLRQTAFRDPGSYFHHVSRLSVEDAEEMAQEVWDRINGENLRENVLPTRGRARLVLSKGPDHTVRQIALRRA